MKTTATLARFAVLASLCAAALSAGVTACGSDPGPGGAGGGGGGEPAQKACDPLAPDPLTLGKIIGVGKDAPGTLYVDAESGIYVSSGDTLFRQHVTGTGEKGTTQFLFTFEDPAGGGAGPRSLLVATDGDTATAMALGPADSKGFLDESPPGITMLTVVPPSTIDGMKVANTPNEIRYVGDVANGNVVMATVPVNVDSSAKNGGLAIFYGPPAAVAQRVIVDFKQDLSGNGTVTFMVGVTPHVLSFGAVFAPDAGPLGEFALKGLKAGDGPTLPVTLRKPTPTALPAGLSFTCLGG